MKEKLSNIKSNKGFTATDIVVAVIIIILFVGLITTVFYNYYLSTAAKNRNAMATNCLIDVIENVKQMNYDDISEQTVASLVEQMIEDGSIPDGYTVSAEVQKYNETEGNTDKLDLIKTLKVKIEYTVSNKKEEFEMSTLITK